MNFLRRNIGPITRAPKKVAKKKTKIPTQAQVSRYLQAKQLKTVSINSKPRKPKVIHYGPPQQRKKKVQPVPEARRKPHPKVIRQEKPVKTREAYYSEDSYQDSEDEDEEDY